MAEPLTTRSDWLAANPPARERLSETLAGVAGRVRKGEDFRHAVREFLDEFALRPRRPSGAAESSFRSAPCTASER
jgi:hypothetical protein